MKNPSCEQAISSSLIPFHKEANKEMGGETQPLAAAAVTVSKVLDDDDLLIEILLRVGFPTTLVCAALVCKRWLGHASDRAFLRRFRKLHPPRLLGFYIDDFGLPPGLTLVFVPVLPQPPELAVVVRRARFKLKTNNARSATIRDCQNGSVFFTLYNGRSRKSTRVHCPLCPERGPAILPQLPRPGLGSNCTFKQVLSKEEGDGMSYYYLYVESARRAETESMLHVYMLQDGSRWTHHLLDIDNLPEPRWEPKAVLVDNKIYMAAAETAIIVLDLSDLSLSTIQLPQGVEHGVIGTTMLARAHDASGVYLIHVEEFQLRIWLHKGGNWSLVDTIFLHEMCANLRNSCCTIEDEDRLLPLNQVVDYGDFVFLKMGGCALQLDIKCRTLRKVYEAKNGHLGFNIHPFMMIWPPTFPTLKYDPARNAMWRRNIPGSSWMAPTPRVTRAASRKSSS
ncbi:hypothetical protein CFC21_073198 [Triticum aestivum]|uniref:F-box protein AT5G49610-like beta-propeller domain-containing protein n=2 Tax=Triticum aestivum TaxID=4565 RepID=A0A3B6LS40_WHEAT|nr:uncharacterized protein LOC123113045 [Triticum aestivum]KAF7067291.1 hypothetical protein CFC21_073198 [Triticum aestivum]